MPSRLKRFHESGQSHFVTFSCYRRRPLLIANGVKRTFETALERVRLSFKFSVYGYVIMPEHVHLLVSEPERETLADAIKSLKQGVSRRLMRSGTRKDEGAPFKPALSEPKASRTGGLSGVEEHFWQKRYYDFNVRDLRQFVEKLRYIHRNPVKRGLCECAEDWEWSSFRHYSSGIQGCVEIESEWTARMRERAAGRLLPVVK